MPAVLTALLFFTLAGSAQADEAKCREIAQQQQPEAGDIQDYIFKAQWSAYQYLLSATDKELISLAMEKHPNDFEQQKSVYDKQWAAKHYISTVTDQAGRRRRPRLGTRPHRTRTAYRGSESKD